MVITMESSSKTEPPIKSKGITESESILPNSGCQTFLMTGDAIIQTNTKSSKSSDSSPKFGLRNGDISETHYIDPELSVSTNGDLNSPTQCSSCTSKKSSKTKSEHEVIADNDNCDEFNSISEASRENISLSSDSLDDLSLDLEHSAQKPCNIDEPSAARLAKRLYYLEGFKRSDVARHLMKNNYFSQKVAEEYLKHFDFTGDSLVAAMRKFFKHFALVGETQERERVLQHFTHRYMMCNPLISEKVHSEDACHTLTCAVMLLNTDLHGQNFRQKMTLNDFIENLANLNEDSDFPKDLLKMCYTSIKQEPFEWARDTDTVSAVSPQQEFKKVNAQMPTDLQPTDHPVLSPHSSDVNPYLDVPLDGIEYKKGYLRKKHSKGTDGIDVPSGKRGWHKHFVVLKDMMLYLMKSEKNGLDDKCVKLHLHHSLARVARHYKKRKNVFSLQTADWSEYLFETSNVSELEDWVNTINLVTSSMSAPPLAAAVGSQKKFHRPLLPSSHTRLSLSDQCKSHEKKVDELRVELLNHEKHPPVRGYKMQEIINYKDKHRYLQFELQRYMVYAQLLRSQLEEHVDLEKSIADSSIGEVDEPNGSSPSHTSLDQTLTGLERRGPANSNQTTDNYQEWISGMYINTETLTTQL